MKIDLSGRVAIVTGGTKGIGRATAEGLAGAGASVAVCARTQADVDRVAAELGTHTQALGIVADLRRAEDIARVVDQTVERFGRLDILVNNAVNSAQNTFEGLGEEDWLNHLEVKLLGYVRMCRLALPHLRQSGRGRVINVAGMSARQVTEFRMTNGVVNAGVTNFTKHLAEQVGSAGITANAVHPGYTMTPRLETGLQRWAELNGTSTEEEHAARVAEIPIGRFVQPADLANLIVFLASDQAAAITGQTIAVDGGSGRPISY